MYVYLYTHVYIIIFILSIFERLLLNVHTPVLDKCFLYTSKENQILWIPKCRVGADIPQVHHTIVFVNPSYHTIHTTQAERRAQESHS